MPLKNLAVRLKQHRLCLYCVEIKKKEGEVNFTWKYWSTVEKAKSKDFSSPRINVSQDSRRPAGSVHAELEGRNTSHLLNTCDLHHCSHHGLSLGTVSFDKTLSAQRNIIIYVYWLFF